MEFSQLSANVFLQIFSYFPLRDQIRLGRLNQCFYQMSTVAVSQTKRLDFSCSSRHPSRYPDPEELASLLNLCSSNLERIHFPRHRCCSILLLEKFAEYQCQNLVELHLGSIKVEINLIRDLLRK